MLINLRNWRNFTAPTNRGGGEDQAVSDPGNDPEYLDARDKFFAYASDVAAKHGTKLIILYYPMEYHLEKDGSLVYTDSDIEYAEFQKMCASHGIAVVSTKARSIEMFEKDRVLPNGFINSNVGYGHFNRYGHEAMADVLYDALTETEVR